MVKLFKNYFSVTVLAVVLGFVTFFENAWAQTFETINSFNSEKIYGELRSRHATALASEIPARIEEITLREGFQFKKGTVLVRLDCALIRAQHEKTKASLVAAKRKYAVEKRLLELNSTGELDVLNAEADVHKVTADMEAGRVRLSKCTIRAPFSGRIVERKMGQHQFAQVGKEILKIIDDQNLEIAFLVPSQWVTWLKSGYKFVFQVNETGGDYDAKVVQRGAKVDAVSRSIVMIGKTIKRHRALIPGMSGVVNIKLPKKE